MAPACTAVFRTPMRIQSALPVALLCAMSARTLADCAPDAVLATGAVCRICMPELARWNGDLVVYAHGYVEPDRPIEIPEDQLVLPDGPSIPQVINLLGYAFAVTSFRTNGLAVREGVADLVDLVGVFSDTVAPPARVYVVGVSQGGLIATRAVEQFPEMFAGGLAACGPIGDFREQLDYYVDVRVLFDYFFPGVLPGSPVEIPQYLIDHWDDEYVPAILDALSNDPTGRERFLQVTSIPSNGAEPESTDAAIVDLLWYNVHATRDAYEKLGGQPFGNVDRRYHGGGTNAALNRSVRRYEADAEALEEIESSYQTSGLLACALVTLHTTEDAISPYWHERLYRRKAFQVGAQPWLANVTVDRYGHCNFNVVELLTAFSVLVWNVTGEPLVGADAVLTVGRTRAEYMKLLRMYGVGR